MQSLVKSLRNQLERTIKDARDIAEGAARAALEQLGVQEATPYDYLTEEERELRRRLRAHGRQLGNGRKANGEQELDRLIEEVAYEHWHRMLFARFLAENNLLMYPDPVDPVAVTLEECEELAAEEGARNGWELASRFAARMLPQIFRPDSPVFQLILPPEYQQKLEGLLADLAEEIFSASDSLGWVYQFWQTKRKEEVNASEVKIGAREIPAVTQLFTEPYMVSFLLDNSLGVWWAGRRLSEGDLKNAKNEDELRNKAALPGVPLEYLRFVKLDDGGWALAAGIFDGWPKQLGDLKTLDPCCGSGHFLVALFLMLVPMRMELEGFTAREAVDAVLRQNIHGLEIDKRCVELAAFALALASWKFPNAGGYRPLPELNVACSGLAISAKKEEWIDLAGDNTDLRLAMEDIYKQFKDAPILGSLITPASGYAKGTLFEIDSNDLDSKLNQALKKDYHNENHEMAIVAHGIAKAATILMKKYNLVATNVPYLARAKHSEILENHIDRFYQVGKNDIATAFLLRIYDILQECGSLALVLPQNWMFLSTYEKMRKQVLSTYTIDMFCSLGSQCFRTPMYDFKIALYISTNKNPTKKSFSSVVDVSCERDIDVKSSEASTSSIKKINQSSQLSNPLSVISSEEIPEYPHLSRFADIAIGMQPAQTVRLVRNFWEIYSSQEWHLMSSSPTSIRHFDGNSEIVIHPDSFDSIGVVGHVIRGKAAWGRNGVLLQKMGKLHASRYLGKFFDDNTIAIIPRGKDCFSAIWAFAESGELQELIRAINKKTSITSGTVAQVPYDSDRWNKVAQEKYPNGLPEPYSDDPTQWIFHGHPCGSVVWEKTLKWTGHGSLRTDDTVLQVAVTRLLGYRWPAELDTNMELSDEQREWVKRCEALLPLADDDGIVCIPPVRGEAAAADRLLNLLAAAYGDAWSNDILAQLLNQVDHAGKTLETWLREKFFLQHCKLFQHRPFIWHIWDGLRDGFAALVNYHKFDYKTLETLIYTYLGDWIRTQKDAIGKGIDGAAEKLAAAENLKKRLELILEGEAPYDIFVRWKPLEKQPIGWNPDLNDGVRLNIRPFVTAQVLRFNKKPQLNISWDKDRGKDVESAPWYHLFNGDRINDYHLSIQEKLALQREKGGSQC